jgi:hypothetical protein
MYGGLRPYYEVQFFRWRGVWPESNKAATEVFNAAAIASSFSNDGEFLPRSIRLRKSTEIPAASASRSCVSPRCQQQVLWLLHRCADP